MTHIDDLISLHAGVNVSGFHDPQTMQKLNAVRNRYQKRQAGWWFRQMNRNNKNNKP